MTADNCIGTIRAASLSPVETMDQTILDQTNFDQTWRDWLADGKRLFVAEIISVMMMFKARDRRARNRRALMHLDDRLLKDIGVTRADVDSALKQVNL